MLYRCEHCKMIWDDEDVEKNEEEVVCPKCDGILEEFE